MDLFRWKPKHVRWWTLITAFILITAHYAFHTPLHWWLVLVPIMAFALIDCTNRIYQYIKLRRNRPSLQ